MAFLLQQPRQRAAVRFATRRGARGGDRGPGARRAGRRSRDDAGVRPPPRPDRHRRRPLRDRAARTGCGPPARRATPASRSVGVTGYRNIAIMAARIMDPRAAEAAVARGLQYADAIEQSHCRQMMATTTALLDWGAGRWDAADERARHELVDRGCRRGIDRLARRRRARRPRPRPARRGAPLARGVARERDA